MVREHIGLVRGSLTLETSTVGPAHDPYGRTTIEMHRDGKTAWSLILCGLAGISFKVTGGPTFKENDYVPTWYGTTDEEKRKGREAFEAEVVKATGQGVYFWERRVWERRDSARWRRMTPQQREEWELCMEADAALMSYAM